MSVNNVFKLIPLVICFCSSNQGIIEATETNNDLLISSDNDLKHTMHDLSLQLGKFHGNHLTNLEQKIETILTTMSNLDANVKSIHDKSQVFEIFRHHIGHWSEHMKSVDQKIDLLRRTQDQILTQESKLSHLDFKVQHIFDKVDIMNEKLHDITKMMYAQNHRRPSGCPEPDTSLESEILSRLGLLQRNVQSIHNNNCKTHTLPKLVKSAPSAASLVASQQFDKDDLFEIKEYLIKINSQLEKIPGKDLKQVIGTSRKVNRNLESLTELVRSVDERTIRIFDADAFQSRKMFLCCKNTEHEVTTFTNSADLLLKKIESLVLGIEVKTNARDAHSGSSVTVNVTDFPILLTTEASTIYYTTEGSGNDNDNEDLEVVTKVSKESIDNDLESLDGSGDNGSGDQENILAEEGVKDNDDEFFQPQKYACHQVLTRKSGVYKFGRDRDFNENNRDFNERVCDFSTDGLAWTVIQKREATDLQENFNRSWHDYKNGFGDLNKEFWFGNDYIHKLTYNDSMELRVELEDFDGNKNWAQYSVFQIASEKFNYNLMIGDYLGGANDSLLYHNDQDFSTYDRANDKAKSECCPCAKSFGGGWWFNNCAESYLNGKYFETPTGHRFMGIIWEKWLGDYSLAKSKMMIRPKEVWFNNDEELYESPISSPDDP